MNRLEEIKTRIRSTYDAAQLSELLKHMPYDMNWMSTRLEEAYELLKTDPVRNIGPDSWDKVSRDWLRKFENKENA